MKKNIVVLALLSLPLFSHAQFGNILKKVKNKAAEIVERKAETATESVLGGGTDKKAAQADSGAGTTTDVKPSAATDPLVAYSRFDFVPGDKVIYADDFSQDAVGEFPLQWTTKGKGEVMTLQGQPGKWLRGYKNSLLTSVNKNELGDNYTVEFDLIYYLGAKAAVYVMPDLVVRLLNNYTVDYKNRSGSVSDREGEQSFQFQIHPKDDASLAWVEDYGFSTHYQSDKVEVSQFSKLYNQPVHYAIQVQKTRLRVWLNEKKVVDLPQAINIEKKPARIALGLGSTSFSDEEVGFYVSNIRMAKGEPDTRHKLLETGSFSTTGILFDVNTDHIKPQSFGLLNELSKLLTDNPSLKIRIGGHTSSDGNAAANLELSNKRAQAVKEYFGKAGIDTSRMETVGLGDTKPVASNGSQEGRAQNRRVEFTKL